MNQPKKGKLGAAAKVVGAVRDLYNEAAPITSAYAPLKAADRAAAGNAAARGIANEEVLKASEALGRAREKGFRKVTQTQADRTRVGGGNIGGPQFSALSLYDPNYAGRAWGVMDEGTASRLKNLSDPEHVFTTMLGSPDQLKTNPVVFEKLKRQFMREVKAGNLPPALLAKINEKLAAARSGKEGPVMFGEGVDILDPDLWRSLDTFDKRAVVADMMRGEGVGGQTPYRMTKKGDRTIGGTIFDAPGTLRGETDPMLLHPEMGGDVETFSVGPRLFSLKGTSEYRPDMHPGFPTLLHGEDLGMRFKPVPSEIFLPDWYKEWKAAPNKEGNPKSAAELKRGPGYYPLALGMEGRGLPSQEITDAYIRHLMREGHAKGGEVHMAKGGLAHMATGGTPDVGEIDWAAIDFADPNWYEKLTGTYKPPAPPAPPPPPPAPTPPPVVTPPVGTPVKPPVVPVKPPTSVVTPPKVTPPSPTSPPIVVAPPKTPVVPVKPPIVPVKPPVVPVKPPVVPLKPPVVPIKPVVVPRPVVAPKPIVSVVKPTPAPVPEWHLRYLEELRQQNEKPPPPPAPLPAPKPAYRPAPYVDPASTFNIVPPNPQPYRPPYVAPVPGRQIAAPVKPATSAFYSPGPAAPLTGPQMQALQGVVPIAPPVKLAPLQPAPIMAPPVVAKPPAPTAPKALTGPQIQAQLKPVTTSQIVAKPAPAPTAPQAVTGPMIQSKLPPVSQQPNAVVKPSQPSVVIPTKAMPVAAPTPTRSSAPTTAASPITSTTRVAATASKPPPGETTYIEPAPTLPAFFEPAPAEPAPIDYVPAPYVPAPIDYVPAPYVPAPIDYVDEPIDYVVHPPEDMFAPQEPQEDPMERFETVNWLRGIVGLPPYATYEEYKAGEGIAKGGSVRMAGGGLAHMAPGGYLTGPQIQAQNGTVSRYAPSIWPSYLAPKTPPYVAPPPSRYYVAPTPTRYTPPAPKAYPLTGPQLQAQMYSSTPVRKPSSVFYSPAKPFTPPSAPATSTVKSVYTPDTGPYAVYTLGTEPNAFKAINPDVMASYLVARPNPNAPAPSGFKARATGGSVVIGTAPRAVTSYMGTTFNPYTPPSVGPYKAPPSPVYQPPSRGPSYITQAQPPASVSRPGYVEPWMQSRSTPTAPTAALTGPQMQAMNGTVSRTPTLSPYTAPTPYSYTAPTLPSKWPSYVVPPPPPPPRYVAPPPPSSGGGSGKINILGSWFKDGGGVESIPEGVIRHMKRAAIAARLHKAGGR